MLCNRSGASERWWWWWACPACIRSSWLHLVNNWGQFVTPSGEWLWKSRHTGTAVSSLNYYRQSFIHEMRQAQSDWVVLCEWSSVDSAMDRQTQSCDWPESHTYTAGRIPWLIDPLGFVDCNAGNLGSFTKLLGALVVLLGHLRCPNVDFIDWFRAVGVWWHV